jgi:hypothetical protein
LTRYKLSGRLHMHKATTHNINIAANIFIVIVLI